MRPDVAYENQSGTMERAWDWECGLRCYLYINYIIE